jgi:hypothetical protein
LILTWLIYWLDIGWVFCQERTQGILREVWDTGISTRGWSAHCLYVLMCMYVCAMWGVWHVQQVDQSSVSVCSLWWVFLGLYWRSNMGKTGVCTRQLGIWHMFICVVSVMFVHVCAIWCMSLCVICGMHMYSVWVCAYIRCNCWEGWDFRSGSCYCPLFVCLAKGFGFVWKGHVLSRAEISSNWCSN